MGFTLHAKLAHTRGHQFHYWDSNQLNPRTLTSEAFRFIPISYQPGTHPFSSAQTTLCQSSLLFSLHFFRLDSSTSHSRAEFAPRPFSALLHETLTILTRNVTLSSWMRRHQKNDKRRSIWQGLIHHTRKTGVLCIGGIELKLESKLGTFCGVILASNSTRDLFSDEFN